MQFIIFAVVCVWLLNKFLIPKYRILFFRYKKINLGTLNTQELTLFEWKPLCSIKLFYFNPGISQEIYHNHSFSAISFLLYGNYMERFIDPKTKKSWEKPRNRSRIITIPRSQFHQITKSEGCLTLMITGPWTDTYQEYKIDANELIISTHGRKIISIINQT